MTGKNEQTFSFEVVSILLAALSENGSTVGNKHYAIMAKLDGAKSQSGYEHMFRAVKARAKQIKDQMEQGGDLQAASATPAKKAKTKAATPKSGSKRGRKAAAEMEDADNGEESPTKKVKAEKSEDEDEV